MRCQSRFFFNQIKHCSRNAKPTPGLAHPHREVELSHLLNGPCIKGNATVYKTVDAELSTHRYHGDAVFNPG